MKRVHYKQSTLQLALLIALQTGLHQAAIAEESSGAAQVATKQYAIPAGELTTSLQTLASESGVILTFTPEQTAGKQSKSLNGRYTVEQAFDTLLTGTGLAAKKNPNNQYSLIKSPSLSPSPQTSATTQLPEVAVTTHAESATKLPPDYAGGQTARGGRLGLLGNKDILDTPFSVTQYTAKLIEDQQAQSIGDVLVNDPSVRNTYSRSSGRDEFNIRGFTLFNYDVLYNGLYGVTPRNTSSLIGIERVEVLRGPNALLNGMAPAGSVGGSINLVPKRAGTTPLNRLTLSYIDDNQLGSHIDVARRFGGEQQLGVRVNAMTSSGDTPVDNANESLDAIAIGVDFQGERVRIEGDFNYQHRNTQGRGGLLFAPSTGKISSAPDADKNFIQQWTYWKTNEVSGAVRAEFDITPAWTIYGALGGKEYDFKSLQTQMQLRDTHGLLAFRPYRLDEAIKNLSAEAGVKGKFTTGPVEHELVFSINSFSQENRLLRSPNVAFSFSNIYSPISFSEPILALNGNLPKTSESRLRSLAIADTISLADRKVQLTLGARLQQVEASNFNGTTGIRTDHYDKSDLTPAIALVIRPTDQLSFYGNYIEALNQGSTAPNGTTNAGQMFAPAVSKQHEAGVKYDFGRFATTLSVFQIERPAGFTNPVTQRFDMDGEQRNRGIELITQGEAIDHLRLLGGLSWTQGKLTQTESGTNDGNTAPAVPKLQFNIAGEWDIPSIPGLTLTARMLHTSPQYVNAANTQKIPTWTRYDLGARYAFVAGKTPITVRGTIENLFDKNYWLSAAREGLTVGAPRTVLLSVTADF
ncbi:TonB-dependent receptor [Methylobacillus gramineus]|uniref:TonB-dependent receptor n=1 Tax=Methylobacillus gramineus TaxID=755169 RepID=UPI001CFF58F7|nr:TonB-dependent receptor [Methylobacillus gramineus]MCB5183989.1 TonB-dependent receptor [Methylobacillus gramineus]